MIKYGIHWFRRDLRVAGNLALERNRETHNGRVLGLFCFDKTFLDRSDFSVNRFQFFLETLLRLRHEMQQLGGDLLVLDQSPQQAFPEIFKTMKDNNVSMPALITWNRDYEPFAMQRDSDMEDILNSHSIPNQQERDHLLIEPHELAKPDGDPYQVYSPFAKKWLEIFSQQKIQERVKLAKDSLFQQKKIAQDKHDKIFSLTWQQLFNHEKTPQDHLEDYIVANAKKVSVPIPTAGATAAWERLGKFRSSLSEYKDKRDYPALEQTSGLSIYLKNGSITVPQVIAGLSLKAYRKKETGEDCFLSELIWREFYYHILYRNPRVENRAFLSQYETINWDNNKEWFSAWKEGKTGFPIVDAGMRELKTTGLMHNRVRMIVASFLTKDLLIDWRWGEQYFMETLLDGDLAANNGGWQWSASTGCDPQPYFRIFNPWLQSKKFDPKGEYIKRHIPELKDLPAKDLHQAVKTKGYPKPIVDHKEQREKALEMYKQEKS